MKKRIFMAAVGIILCGVVVSMLNIANLGADPFTVFVVGIANIFGTTYGHVYIFVTGALLILVFFLNKHYIGLGTILNLFGIGYIADFMTGVFNSFLTIDTYPERIAFFVLALVILCLSSSFYFTADLGVSSYDAIALHAGAKKIAPFRACRIVTDCICVAFGAIFGAKIGVGTVITALCMGPIIQWFNHHVAEPFLYGRRK